jgi:hypothetical protein
MRNRALDLLVGVEHDLVGFEHKADGQGKAQLALVRLIQLPAVEAPADDVQFCLSEGALHAEDQRIVELGRIVATILVDHERVGDRTQLQQPVPVLVRARQARRLQGEDGADLAQGDLAHQGLEVGALARR